MNINFYLIFTVFCTSTCLHASQVAQKEVAKRQYYANQLELRMIKDARNGSLTEKKLQQYLKKGATIDAKGKHDDTALTYASWYGHAAIVKLLIDADAYINAKDSFGSTALMFASWYGHIAIVQQLITAGANINHKSNHGCTALKWASWGDHTAVVQLLIIAGADINAKDNNGGTVLMWASSTGHTAVVQQLIAVGADTTMKDTSDRTAREYAPDKDAYDKAFAAGLQEGENYPARQSQAKQIIEEEKQLIPVISNIIAEYAYGSSLTDLPPTQTQVAEKKSNCAVQ